MEVGIFCDYQWKEEYEETIQQVISMTFTLGILSHATAPQCDTFLPVCSATAGASSFSRSSCRQVSSDLLDCGPLRNFAVVKHCHCRSTQYH